MNTQNSDIEINKIRYNKRAKDEAWARDFLKRTPFGILATESDGQPFQKPSLFAYDEQRNAIYIHGALEGRMRTNVEANPRVSFCAAEMGRLLPADMSMDFGVEYASVVVFGTAVLVTDEEEARRGLQLILDRYFPLMIPGEDYREITQEELDITAVTRIDIQAVSGKETHQRPDFPGAFHFSAPA